MKFMTLAAVFIFSLNASAASLEDLWAQQTSIVIEPVRIKGVSVLAASTSAILICSSLGSLRLVSYEKEPCDVAAKEPIAVLFEEGSVVGVQEQRDIFCGPYKYNGDETERIKSVTCAR